MTGKPDIFLLSASVENAALYRQRAEQLNAKGYVGKGSSARFDLFAAQSGKNVILIDDNPDYLESSAELLKSMGAIVYAFNSPLEALKQIEELKPDTVLSDVEMPEASGFAVLKAINEMKFE